MCFGQWCHWDERMRCRLWGQSDESGIVLSRVAQFVKERSTVLYFAVIILWFVECSGFSVLMPCCKLFHLHVLMPLCPISLSLFSLFLSRFLSPCTDCVVWIGNQGLAFRGRNSRFSELSTVSASLVDLERTSNCAGSLFHFLISGSGSNQS